MMIHAITCFGLFLEVLDKLDGAFQVSAQFLAIGIIGFAITRIRWWLIPLPLCFSIFLAFIHLNEFHDEHIYPAIIKEDSTYLPKIYASIIFSLIFPIIGAILNVITKKRAVN